MEEEDNGRGQQGVWSWAPRVMREVMAEVRVSIDRVFETSLQIRFSVERNLKVGTDPRGRTLNRKLKVETNPRERTPEQKFKKSGRTPEQKFKSRDGPEGFAIRTGCIARWIAGCTSACSAGCKVRGACPAGCKVHCIPEKVHAN
ncbi:hypothetical protein CRG98_013305 [Punica granatum]|uniref:Uncharacterized protein n=1 Tax=Punica granatum TaxID=22663 RepID=A0A2I0KDU1_PUNGR|nr:hypothetical protein CRG98_013305 [Punica granatum]